MGRGDELLELRDIKGEIQGVRTDLATVITAMKDLVLELVATRPGQIPHWASYEPPDGGLSSRIDLPENEWHDGDDGTDADELEVLDPDADPLATLIGVPDFPAEVLVDFDVRRRARLPIRHTKTRVHVIIPRDLWDQFPADEEALLIPPVMKGDTDKWDEEIINNLKEDGF